MSAALAPRTRLRLPPLQVLVDELGTAGVHLPEELAAVYSGPFALQPRTLYANFVASLDGVTAIPAQAQSSHLIALGSEHDRFVMGLLRAFADAVLIGAGTLSGSPRTRWTSDDAYPPAAPLYAELRRRRGRSPQPTLAVLSGSGRIDPEHPGLREHALVLTSDEGAARLAGRLPASAVAVPLAERPPIDPAAAVEALRARGHELILCEGGPTLFGAFTAAGLVDELFLTLSPALTGRPSGDPRLSLVEQAALPVGTAGTLLSLRRSGSHLFLRYRLPAGEPAEQKGGTTR